MDTKARIYRFAKARKLAVIATNSIDGPPECALVGVAISPELELVFDTMAATRKADNLRRDPRMSAVIGLDGEESIQFEGVAEDPTSDDLTRIQELYFDVYPHGRARLAWEGIRYFRVRPVWIRFTSYLHPETSGELFFN